MSLGREVYIIPRAVLACFVRRLGPKMHLSEYMSHHPYLLAFAALMALAVVIFEWQTRQAEFAAVGPQDVIRLMNQGALVLDLRPTEAFAQGHINGARSFSSDQILNARETLKKYQDKTVVVCCETGSLGVSATRELARQGFAKAVNLRGGVAAWRTESLPLTRLPNSKGKA